MGEAQILPFRVRAVNGVAWVECPVCFAFHPLDVTRVDAAEHRRKHERMAFTAPLSTLERYFETVKRYRNTVVSADTLGEEGA